MNFASVAINNTGGDGIEIGGANGAITISGGAIGNTDDPSGRGVFINGGSGNVTINASVSKTTGDLIEVTGRTGGVVAFGGNFATALAGGIDVNTNTGGTIDFSGAGQDADDRHQYRRQPGQQHRRHLSTSPMVGWPSTPPPAPASRATGGGTVLNVSGTGNGVATATGQILNWTGVNVGASGVTFAFARLDRAQSLPMPSRLTMSTAPNFNGGAVTIAGTSGHGSDGIAIIGGSAATFNFASATIDNTSGNGINLDGANGAVTFTTVDIDGTTGAGVFINANTNAVNINGGSIGATNDPAGIGVDINGGSGNVTVAASVTKTTAGDIVEVTGRTGGTVSLQR